MIKKNVLIATGGTGGHVSPAIAVAEELKKEHNCTITIDHKGKSFLDKISWKDKDIKLNLKYQQGISGSFFRKIFAVGLCGINILRSIIFLKKNNIDVVYGFGAYASFADCFAARILKIPYVIFNADKDIGLANKLLIEHAKIIVTGLSNENIPEKHLDKARNLSTPVREEVRKYSIIKKDVIASEYRDYNNEVDNFFHKNSTSANIKIKNNDLDKSIELKEKLNSFFDQRKPKEMRILIIGGSDGVDSWDNTILSAINLMPDAVKKNITIVCQSDRGDELRQQYLGINCNSVNIKSFIKDMGKELNEADIVISRAGCSAITECAMFSKKTILIPNMNVSQNHQFNNAELLKNCLCYLDREDDYIKLSLFIAYMIYNHEDQRFENAFHALFDYNSHKKMAGLIKEIFSEGSV